MFMPWAEWQPPLCSLQLTITYSQSTPVCQASKQPEITVINSLNLTMLTGDQKAAITPASLGSFSMARSPDWLSVQKSAGKGLVALWANNSLPASYHFTIGELNAQSE